MVAFKLFGPNAKFGSGNFQVAEWHRLRAEELLSGILS